MVDALKRASAETVSVVMPYYGYARQDRKTRGREPITAKLVANLMQTSGITRLVTIDLHAGQIQGFFDVPVDNVFGSPVLLDDILKKTDLVNPIVVSSRYRRCGTCTCGSEIIKRYRNGNYRQTSSTRKRIASYGTLSGM